MKDLGKAIVKLTVSRVRYVEILVNSDGFFQADLVIRGGGPMARGALLELAKKSNFFNHDGKTPMLTKNGGYQVVWASSRGSTKGQTGFQKDLIGLKAVLNDYGVPASVKQ